MALNDPVLQRSMFRGQRPMSSAPAGTAAGIGSIVTPDENAKALRSMFQTPQSMALPVTGMQPVQSFQTGGLAERLEITPPPDFSVEPVSSSAPPAPPPAPPATAAPVAAETPREYPIREGIRSLFNWAFPPRASTAAQTPPAPPPRPSVPELPPPVEVGPAPGMREPPPTSVSAPSVTTNLEEIRARREAKDQARTAAERRENVLLALMQAGFATAAGTSPYALSNIGAGGQAGIGAFANLERARREDEASRRRETLQRDISMAQLQKEPEAIRTYAMLGGWRPEMGSEGMQAAIARGIQVQKSMQQDPEQVRFLTALGGGDLRKGFEIYNADKKIAAAQAILRDITSSDEDKKGAMDYLRSLFVRANSAGTGGQTPPAGSTVIPFNQLPVR